MTSRSVGPDEFRDALRPLVEALHEFSAVVDAVAPRHGRTPWANSLAMREIADEHRYSGPSGWDQPIHDTHMLGDLTLRAAADYVRTFAEAFLADRAPVYGHLVVARAALESSAVSAWLSEPGIARDARVKRGLSDFLYTAVEESRLKIRDDDESVKVWIDRANKLGWQATDYNGKAWSDKSRGKPVIDGVGRPSTGAGITRLLVSDDESKVGGTPMEQAVRRFPRHLFRTAMGGDAGDARRRRTIRAGDGSHSVPTQPGSTRRRSGSSGRFGKARAHTSR